MYGTVDGKRRALQRKSVCKKCAGSITPQIRPAAVLAPQNEPCNGDLDDLPLAKFFDLLDQQRKKGI